MYTYMYFAACRGRFGSCTKHEECCSSYCHQDLGKCSGKREIDNLSELKDTEDRSLNVDTRAGGQYS